MKNYINTNLLRTVTHLLHAIITKKLSRTIRFKPFVTLLLTI